MTKPNFLKLAKLAARICDDKKGQDILLLSVRKLTAIADYFLIATALSPPHLRALSETVRKTFREELGMGTIHGEGKNSPHWAVLDYGGLVIHIMTGQAREFYALENIWNAARKLKFK